MIVLLIHLSFAVLIFFLTIAFITGAPFVPSSQNTAQAMIDLAHITRDSVIYDLGSGDGRLLLLASKNGARKIVGIEINPWLVFFTKIRILLSKAQNVQVYLGNFWSADLKDANIVFVYLLPWKMESLAKKLKKDLKPGTIIVSNSFIFPGWKILREDKTNHVYVFQL